MMWSRFLLLLASAVTCAVAVDSDNDNIDADQESLTADYAVGNPWYCMERAKAKGYDMEIMEVLPGYGWDNLRNVNEGQVVAYNYSQCRTTHDGRFLLPDSVSAVPVKSSRVQYFAELISDWKSWTSINSKSINIQAGLEREFVSISGKFSYDFEEVKSKQVGEQSATTRTQLRYTRYAVQLQPDSPLHPVFKKRLLDIAAVIANGEDAKGVFLAELLVRDFGTHILTKANAGGALIQIEQVKTKWVDEETTLNKRTEILASASANFFAVYKIDISASLVVKTSDQFKAEYNDERTSSNVIAEGGPLFLPSNFTANTWAKSLERDLVALDRSGNPLFFVITEGTLPELPTALVRKVYDTVKEAVTTYYSYNVIRGCLNPTSEHFSRSANVDDGTCTQKSSNLTFGGVFQICRTIISQNRDLCKRLRQVNPLTGGYSCPRGYFPVNLRNGTNSYSSSREQCTYVWLFWRSCKTIYYTNKAEYMMFWCAATSSVPARSGYLFGGVYTSRVANPITLTKSCPQTFRELRIGDQADLTVCVTDNRDFGQQTAVFLGGFYSCVTGNPIAANNRSSKDNPGSWPARCPPGYNSHLAYVDHGCQINYCVLSGSIAGPVVPPVKRPPFCPEPPMSPPQTQKEFFFDPVSGTWKRDGEPKAMSLRASTDSSLSAVNALSVTMMLVSLFLSLFSACRYW